MPESTREPSASGLRADRLSVDFGAATVVDGLDLAVPAGRLTVLIGPNGSGKSTTLRALAGLIGHRGGEVLLDGRPLAGLPLRAVARRIGVLSQGAQAPEGVTVRDLVEQGRYPYRSLFSGRSARDAEACANALRLTGMEGLRERPLASLSGGQRQRAWIAMTLAQETDILLLDEPTTYLDLAHQLDVLELVKRLVRERQKTVVAVLHDINQAARYADFIAVLKAGRIAAFGPPKSVLTADIIADVFGVRSVVIADPVTGTPMCIPLPPAGHRAEGEA